MAHPGTFDRESQDVAGLERLDALVDGDAQPGLLPAHPRQDDAGLAVRVLTQPGAVVAVGAVPTPPVRRSHHFQRRSHNIRRDLTSGTRSAGSTGGPFDVPG